MSFKCNCGGYLRDKKMRVLKAESSNKSGNQFDFEELNKIADKLESGVASSIAGAFKVFGARLSEKEIEALIKRNEIAQVEDLIPFDKLSDDLADFERRMQLAINRAGKKSLEFEHIKGLGMEFDVTNPRITEWMSRNIGLLMVQVTEQTRQTVNRMIRRTITEGLTPREVAKGIINIVGLTPKMEVSLHNFKQNMIKEHGLDRAELLAAKKHKKMLKVRSKAIARTELTRAMNFAQLETWNQAMDLGLIDRQAAKKEWLSTIDPVTSDICNELDGQIVGVNESFWSAVDGISLNAPPAHVNCRSGMQLLFQP